MENRKILLEGKRSGQEAESKKGGTKQARKSCRD